MIVDFGGLKEGLNKGEAMVRPEFVLSHWVITAGLSGYKVSSQLEKTENRLILA